MTTIKIYRVKALDSEFVSVWFFDKAECRQIIKRIQASRISRLSCGSRHVIEEAELRG